MLVWQPVKEKENYVKILLKIYLNILQYFSNVSQAVHCPVAGAVEYTSRTSAEG